MKKSLKFAISSVFTIAFFTGCNGGSSSSGDKSTADEYGSAFSGGDSNGRLDLNFPGGNTVSVADVVGFSVSARSTAGAAVTTLPVTCDTEAGLAIIEPSSGTERTDSNGEISGKVGCSLPGSYLMVCRASGMRVAETIICDGEVPTGFTGFPAPTAGGGLSGGAGPINPGTPGGADSTNVRITTVQVFDSGEGSAASTTSIDTQQDLCKISDTEFDPEPFFDTHVSLGVVNNSNSTITFTHMRIFIQNADGLGNDFLSSRISLIGEASSALGNGGVATFNDILLFDAGSSRKKLSGMSSFFPSSGMGFRNVRFYLIGRAEDGTAIEIQATKALSFDDFNKCAA